MRFDYVFVTTKTYAFDSVVDEMEKADIAKPKIAVMLHNGIVQPIFKGLGNGYVPCVIPPKVHRGNWKRQVYHQSKKRGETVGDAEYERGEESPRTVDVDWSKLETGRGF